MTELRLINLSLWLIVGLAMLPTIGRIFRGVARTDDPARVVYFAFSVIVVGFNARYLAIPENTDVQSALYALSIGLAPFTLYVAHQAKKGRPWKE